MSKENIAKEINSAVQFEEELQLSCKEGGIAVCDVYSNVWGPCWAITPTFRRLFFEADEAMKLKFFTVDANAVINELDGKVEAPRREGHKPKVTEAMKQTLPDFWGPILREYGWRAKPQFLFWKEGKLVAQIDGVNTPAICETLRDLMSVKTPANEYITNPGLLELWNEYFNPLDSEVRWAPFLNALTAICKLTVPLTDEEHSALKKALNVDKDGVVTAAELQTFAGTHSLMQAFTTLLPSYEDRAIQVRIEQEAEARRSTMVRQASMRGEEISGMRKTGSMRREGSGGLTAPPSGAPTAGGGLGVGGPGSSSGSGKGFAGGLSVGPA